MLGSWEMTTPWATVSECSSWRETVSPAFLMALFASASDLPTTLGTLIGWRPLDIVTVTAESWLTAVSAATDCETTLPSSTDSE